MFGIFFFLILQLLMPVFPGQLRYIKKNIYHAVYVLDPGTHCGAKVSLLSVAIYLTFKNRNSKILCFSLI